MGAIDNINKFLGVAGEKPVTLNSVNGISIEDKPINAAARSIISSAANIQTPILGVSKEEYINEIERNNIVLNPFVTEEELNEQRAKNQNWLEQGVNSLGQLLGGEIVLGTLQGFTNLYDTAATIVKEIASGGENVNDFTSKASLFFEEKKDELKERLKIYRENPTESWDVGDFAWWADNFVSVGSTLSLMIPAIATTKAVSALGRAAKMAKLSKTASDAAKATRTFNGASNFSKSIAANLYKKGLVKSTKETAGFIDTGAQVLSNAFLQRTLENWQESREVYKLTYEDALNKLNNLNQEEFKKLVERNPDFVDDNGLVKSNEQIASLIAEKGAYKTFGSDYALLMFDIMQFAAIPSMYRGLANRHANARLQIANQNVKKALSEGVGATTKGGVELTEVGKGILQGTGKNAIKNNIWNRIKTAAKDPFNSFVTLQLTEGIEEGYQAITTEKGQEVADLIFDPNTNTRSLNSYLQDGHVWEQAFWGVIGAWAFSGAGKALARAERKIEEKRLKGKLSDEDFARATLSDEKLRELEIVGRIDKINEYKRKLDLLNEGKNPEKKDKDGNHISVSSEEADLYKRKYTSDFITDLVLEAADNGNFDLLHDFITSREFSDYARENGLLDLLSSGTVGGVEALMNKVYGQYKDDLYTALEYAEDNNPWVANILARNTTRTKLTIDDIQNQINEINSNIDTSINDANTKAKLKHLQDYFTAMNLQKAKLDAMLNTKVISKEAYDQYVKDYIKEIKAVFSEYIDVNKDYVDFSGFLTNIHDEFQQYKNNINSTLSTEQADKATEEAAEKIAALEVAKSKYNSIIPVSNEEWNDAYKEIESVVTQTGREKLLNASRRLKKYIGEHENPKIAYAQLLNSENVYEGALEDLELVKIGYEDTARYWSELFDLANAEVAEREEIARREAQPTNDGERDTSGSTENITQNPPEQSSPELTPQTTPQPAAEPAPQTTVAPEETYTEEPEVQITDEEEAILRGITETDETELADKTVDPALGQNEKRPIDKRTEEDINKLAQSNKRSTRLIKLINSVYGALSPIIFDRTEDYYRIKLNTEELSSDDFKVVYDLVAEEIERIIDIEISESEKEKMIYSVIDKFLDKLIFRYQNDNTKVYDVLKTKILKSKLFSEIALIGDDKSEKDARMLKELREYLKDVYGLKQIRKTTKRAINVIDFFNYLANKYNAGFNELAEYYRFINEYLESGIEGISFTMTESFREGFESFLRESVAVEEIKESETPVTSFNVSQEFNNLDEEQRNEFIYKVATGKITPKLYIEQGSETYTSTDNYGNKHEKLEYPSSLSIYYVDEKGNKQRIGYIPKAHYIGADNRILVNMTGEGFNFEFTNSNLDSNFDNFIFTFIDNFENESSPYYKLYDELIKYSKNPERYIFEGLPEDILNIPEIRELLKYGSYDEFISTELTNQYLEKEDSTIPVYNKGGIRFKTKKNETRQVEEIIKNLYRVLRDSKGVINPDDMTFSYIGYKQVLYTNMKNNVELQNQLLQGHTIIADIGLNGINIVPNTTEESNNISDVISVEDLEKHPILLTTDYTSAIDENGKTRRVSAQKYGGRLNLVIYDYNDHAVITPLNRNTLRNSGSEIIKDVKEELRNIIRDYLENKVSYEETTVRFRELLQGKRYNKLFSGINVKQHNGFTVIQSYNQSRKTIKNANDEDVANDEFGLYILAINKYAKDDKNKEDRYVISHFNKNKGFKGVRKYSPNYIESVINRIVDELSFNQSRFMYDNVGSPNAKFSKHFYKEDGKIVIDIAGKKRVYNSYQEFLVKENAVTANIAKNADGQLYDSKYSSTYSLLNIREAFLRPIENKDGKIIKTLDELYEELKSRGKTTIKSANILEIAGIDEDIIKILLGDKTGDALITAEIDYDVNNEDNDKMYGEYDPSTGKVSLGNKVFDKAKTAAQQKNRNKELVRTLIHEHFHKIFTENADKDFIKKRKKELIDTLVAFRNAINNDTSNSKNVENIKKTLTKFLDDIVIENGVIKNQDSSTMKQSKQLDIIEEWLVESLTQPVLANYLNNTKYENADVTAIKENKSIFQKIVDVIIKLFNKIFGVKFGEIKNNTIFAKQYLILSDKLTSPPTTKEQEKFEENTKPKRQRRNTKKIQEQEPTLFDNIDETPVGVQQGISPVGGEQQAESVTEKEPSDKLTEEELNKAKADIAAIDAADDFEEDEDDFSSFKFSEIPLIPDDTATIEENIVTEAKFNENTNPSGSMYVDSMSEFEIMFGEDNKLKIATLLSEGKIKYQC